MLEKYEVGARVVIRFRKLRIPGRVVRVVRLCTSVKPIMRDLALQYGLKWPPGPNRHRGVSRNVPSHIVLADNGRLYWPHTCSMERE